MKIKEIPTIRKVSRVGCFLGMLFILLNPNSDMRTLSPISRKVKGTGNQAPRVGSHGLIMIGDRYPFSPLAISFCLSTVNIVDFPPRSLHKMPGGSEGRSKKERIEFPDLFFLIRVVVPAFAGLLAVVPFHVSFHDAGGGQIGPVPGFPEAFYGTDVIEVDSG